MRKIVSSTQLLTWQLHGERNHVGCTTKLLMLLLMLLLPARPVDRPSRQSSKYELRNNTY